MSIQNLEPRHLWQHFDRIRSIPRPSRHEEKIQEHLLAWAKERGFPARADKARNTVISVPASKGHEKAPTLVLQAHMDMVCEKNADVSFDFSKDAIQLQRDGDWLTAKGTTLGADNGIGLAAALAIADDPAVTHGPLELLITSDEETGLNGAAQLDASLVTGRRLLNLDTEELYAIYIGCSGGGNSTLTIPVSLETSPKGSAIEIAVTGLKGGHSGMEIQLQRGNAIRLLARLLRVAGDACRIARIEGGNAHNAIPREARALCVLTGDSIDTLRSAVEAEARAIKEELSVSDPGVMVSVNPAKDALARVFDAVSGRRVAATLAAIPHGVDAMSLDVPGLVESSSNLAAVRTEKDAVSILVSVRSSVRSSLLALRDRVQAAAELAGGSVDNNNPYPGWKPNLKSEVLRIAQGVHQKKLGREAELKAVHAGLECGVIGEKLPGIDMISIGPWIEGPHSPDERVNVPSVATFWTFLTALVAELA